VKLPKFSRHNNNPYKSFLSSLDMKIYVSHSKEPDFKKELYQPLRQSNLNDEHEIILPHETSDKPYNSKELMKTFDVVLGEVSYPATGLGIELGWADAFNIPIIALCKKDKKLKGSVRALTDRIVRYSTSDELVVRIKEELSKLSKSPRPALMKPLDF